MKHATQQQQPEQVRPPERRRQDRRQQQVPFAGPERRKGPRRASDGQDGLEQLEGRRLMSTVDFSHGVLTVTGNGTRPNHLDVAYDKTGRHVVARANGVTKSELVSALKSIKIVGGAKRDVISVAAAIRVNTVVYGRAGNDVISTGAGNDVVYGGPGNDVISAGAGNDRVHGNGGRDHVHGDAGNDLLAGDAGRDSLYGDRGTDRLVGGGGRDNVDKPAKHAVDGGAGATPAGLGRVVSFSLINADTNQVVPGYAALADGVTLNLATLPSRHLSLRANVADEPASVAFKFEGSSWYHIENDAPHALVGDVGGNYAAWTGAKAGSYTLVALPFGKKYGQGIVGQSKRLSFTIIDKPAVDSGGGGGGTGGSQTGGGGNGSSSGGGGTDNSGGGGAGGGTDNGGDTGGGDDGGGTAPIDQTGQSGAPAAVIKAMDVRVNAGQAIHVDGLSSKLGAGDVLDAKFQWDFGDPGSNYNRLRGFNAAHAYAAPGTYTVTLTVTNRNGKASVDRQTVTIAAANRRFVYVSPGGDDSNSGGSPGTAVRSFDRAAQLLDDDTEVLFERGNTYAVKNRMVIRGHNVAIGAYGTGDNPTLEFRGTYNFGAVIGTTKTARDVLIANVQFDSTLTGNNRGWNDAVVASGTNVTIRGCVFRNASYAINTNGKPVGLLAQDNVCPVRHGLRSYFAYVQGSDHVYLGNTAIDAQLEHSLRVDDCDRVLIWGNHFSNPAKGGVTKGTLTIHATNFLYAAENQLAQGKATIGPLGNGDGKSHPGDRTNWVVFENNQIKSPVIVEHGSNHVSLHDNVVQQDNTFAFEIMGYDSWYKRNATDVRVDHNTALNGGTKGQFIMVGGGSSKLSLTNNLYVAPHLQPGSYNSAAVWVRDNGLGAFTEIGNNVWPAADPLAYAQGGVNYVGPASGQAGYLDGREWNAYGVVKNDVFLDVTKGQLGGDYQLSLNGVSVGSARSAAAA